MAENEESIFDAAEVTEDIPSTEGVDDDEVISTSDEWKPTISSESPKERLEKKGQKLEANGRILTVKEWFFTRPKTKDQDGQAIEPKLTQTGKKPFFPGKLGVRFEEDNLVEYYPTVRYFVNDGKVSTAAKLSRSGESCIAQLVALVQKKMGKPLDELSDVAILDFLKGKKVKIVTKSGKFNGSSWFRNDIESFA